MKNLQEIVHIVTKKKLKNIQALVLHTNGKPANNYQRFYEALLHGKFSTDEEAARYFETSKSKSTYRELKRRFKKRLLNSLFFLDNKSSSEYQRAYYDCMKNYELLRILGQNGCRHAAVELAHSTIRIALKYKLTEVALLTSQTLRNHYGARGLKKEYAYYSGLVDTSLKVLEAELEAKKCYEDMMVEYARSAAPAPGLMRKTGKSIRLARRRSKKYDSYVLDNFLYRSWVSCLQIKDNHARAIRTADLALSHLRKKHPFCENLSLATIALMKLESCLHVKSYSKGRTAAAQCHQWYPQGNANLLTFYEYYFLLAMHNRNYRQAAIQFGKAKEHPMFTLLPQEQREKWKLFEAYLHFVKEKSAGSFKVRKFLNDVLIFSKDKSGYNIPVLIIQVLLLLKEDRYESIKERKDALQMYSKRYLEKHTTYRSHCFMKMLLLMIKYGFDYKKTKATAHKYLLKLQSDTTWYQGKVETVEVIPYPVLWEMVLKHLEGSK